MSARPNVVVMTHFLHTSRPRTLAVSAASALIAAGALSGCGNGLTTSTTSSPSPGDISDSATPTPSSAASDPSVSPSPARSTDDGDVSGSTGSSGSTRSSGSSSSSHRSSSGSSAPHAVSRCTDRELDVGLATPAGGGAAGSAYVLLTFTNSGRATCTLDGHPGVSFVGKGNGTQLGTSADRYGKVTKVTLQPGARTTAQVRVVRAGNFGVKQCAPTTADGFRVYPPGSRASVYVPYKTRACQGKLGRGHSQLQVSAVGGAS